MAATVAGTPFGATSHLGDYMGSIAHVASALLPFAHDQEIRDFLFRKAVEVDKAAFGPALSREVAMSYYRRDLYHVLAISANTGTDPQVLEKFAKDPRVSVRTALVRNPALPYSAVVSIASWGLDRRDDNVSNVALPRLSPDDFAALTAEAASNHKGMFRSLRLDESSCHIIAGKLSGDPAACRTAVQLSNRNLTYEVARLVHLTGIPGLTLQEIVQLDPKSAPSVVAALAKHHPMLTVDLASAMLELPVTSPVVYPVEPFALVETGSVEMLAAGRTEHLVLALLNGADDALIRANIATMSMASLSAVVSAMRSTRTLSSQTEAALATRFVELGGEDSQRVHNQGHYHRITLSVSDVLAVLSHPLPQVTLLKLIRAGSDASTRSWLSRAAGEDFPNRLRPGMLSTLTSEPESAFAKYVQSSGSKGYGTNSWKQLPGSEIRSHASAVASACTPEMAAEVIALFDEFIGENLAQSCMAKVVYPVMRETLGTGIEAWETALMLAAEWNGTFTDLLSAVCSLVGIQEPAQAADAVAGVQFSEQLRLV